MIIITSTEADWAGAYDRSGNLVTEGHSADVTEWVLDQLGVKSTFSALLTAGGHCVPSLHHLPAEHLAEILAD